MHYERSFNCVEAEILVEMNERDKPRVFDRIQPQSTCTDLGVALDCEFWYQTF